MSKALTDQSKPKKDPAAKKEKKKQENRFEFEEDEFKPQYEWQGSEKADVNTGKSYDFTPVFKDRKARGRKGADAVYKLVSSKMARDITRKGQWMAPAAFEEWRQNNPDTKLVGRMEDYDDDGEPIEFVVRRGEGGPVVAVNGYTTKASDYPWKRDYYEAYPTKDDRKKKSYDDFIEEFYNPQYADDNITLQHVERRGDLLNKKLQGRGYAQKMPKSRSAYQAITSLVVHPAINAIISELCKDDEGKEDADRMKAFRASIWDQTGKGAGYASQLCSDIYKQLITVPIWNYLSSRGILEQQAKRFESIKQRTKPQFEFDSKNPEIMDMFVKWLHSQKAYKEMAVDLVANYVNKDNIDQTMEECIASLQTQFDLWFEVFKKKEEEDAKKGKAEAKKKSNKRQPIKHEKKQEDDDDDEA